MAKPGGSITKTWGTLGGNTKMHSFAPTGTQVPDRTSQEGHSGSRRGIEPQAGPSNVMGFSSGANNKDFAGTREAGTTSPTKTGSNDKFAKGGSGKMFGNRGSLRAEAGKTSP